MPYLAAMMHDEQACLSATCILLYSASPRVSLNQLIVMAGSHQGPAVASMIVVARAEGSVGFLPPPASGTTTTQEQGSFEDEAQAVERAVAQPGRPLLAPVHLPRALTAAAALAGAASGALGERGSNSPSAAAKAAVNVGAAENGMRRSPIVLAMKQDLQAAVDHLVAVEPSTPRVSRAADQACMCSARVGSC